MTSGNASARLPIIIRLSSIAVFSAPLTDYPADRRRLDRRDRLLRNTLRNFLYLLLFPHNFAFQHPERRKCILSHFHLVKLQVRFTGVCVLATRDQPCACWIYDFIFPLPRILDLFIFWRNFWLIFITILLEQQ